MLALPDEPVSAASADAGTQPRRGSRVRKATSRCDGRAEDCGGVVVILLSWMDLGSTEAERPAVNLQVAFQRAQLLSWLARLRYLHSVCCNEFLQSVCLSIWSSSLAARTPDELLDRFRKELVFDHVEAEPNEQSSPLSRAVRCAQQRQGRPLELALCFVALCNALGSWSARLVLAFDLKEPQKLPRSVKHDSPEEQKAEAAEAVELDEDEELPLEGAAREAANRMVEMGFDKEKAVEVVLEAEAEVGAERCLQRAMELIVDTVPFHTPRKSRKTSDATSTRRSTSSRKTGGGVTCEKCNEAFQTGAFCGTCGARLRQGGATGSADAPVETDTDEFSVTCWAELYDASAEKWVAVDVAFGDLVRFPVVEWLHRGTPMVWICASSRNGSVDVTPRYSPRWWEVELAREPRGSRPLQNWWNELLEGTVVLSEAEIQDQAFLAKRRQMGGVPTSLKAFKNHPVYRLGPAKTETLRPGSHAVQTVEGQLVYFHKDIVPLRSVAGWRRQGRKLKEGEQPIQISGSDALALVPLGEKPTKAAHSSSLYAEWQTEALSAEDLVRRRSSTRRASGLPELPAPVKKRKVAEKPLKGFDKMIKSLRSFVETEGYLPYKKGGKEGEKDLALWVMTAQKAYQRGALPKEQKDALEALEPLLDDFTWAGEEEEEELNEEKEDKVEDAKDAADGGPDGPEDEAARWTQHVLQRLERQLLKADAAERRKLLRGWQLSYHPDRNPGRADEVKPLFQFVQARWDREFKKACSAADEMPAAAEAASSAPKRRVRGKTAAEQRGFIFRAYAPGDYQSLCSKGQSSQVWRCHGTAGQWPPCDVPPPAHGVKRGDEDGDEEEGDAEERLVYYINPHWDPDSGYNGGGLDVFLTDPRDAPPSASTARKAPKFRIAPHADTLAIFLSERMAHQVVETMGKERMYCLTMWCFDQFALSNFVPQVSQKQRDLQAGSDDDY
ncbi:unnamed protein product [Durusdinium trenchii]|uniref:UBA domain-containing protein n=1 Tax=Durusdinium trenchii TaxID=1381693 RepID=A0ABP0QA91_9DINO